MDEERKIPGYTRESVNYSQAELEGKALNFIKQCKKKDCKSMSKAEIAEWATLKANAARRYAENLITSGVWDQEAWNRAIRSEILESETD